MGSIARLLPYLPLLICPLMMAVCVLGMRGMGRQERPARGEPAGPGSVGALPAPERIAELEREVAELRAELDRSGWPADAAVRSSAPDTRLRSAHQTSADT
jgi:hypothetical protein